MKDDVIRFEIKKVDEKQIPSIIAGQVHEIEKLKYNVEKATKNAQNAKNSASKAKEKSAGFGQKKVAIESLQEATVDLAEAQMSSVEAQKVSFEYQKRLGEITKYLFALGCTNLAANRSVVRELKLAMEGASQEEFDDLARQEIENVIKQLKAQEDIMNKQAELAKRVKAHERQLLEQQEIDETLAGRIDEQLLKDAEQDEKIKANLEKDIEQDEMIAQQIQKDKEHDRLLAEGVQKDIEQDEIIAQQEEKDREHDRMLAEGAQKDIEQDESIARQEEKNKKYDKQFEEMTETINSLKYDLEASDLKIREMEDNKTDKKITTISMVIATLALLASFIQFFI